MWPVFQSTSCETCLILRWMSGENLAYVAVFSFSLTSSVEVELLFNMGLVTSSVSAMQLPFPNGVKPLEIWNGSFKSAFTPQYFQQPYPMTQTCFVGLYLVCRNSYYLKWHFCAFPCHLYMHQLCVIIQLLAFVVTQHVMCWYHKVSTYELPQNLKAECCTVVTDERFQLILAYQRERERERELWLHVPSAKNLFFSLHSIVILWVTFPPLIQ